MRRRMNVDLWKLELELIGASVDSGVRCGIFGFEFLCEAVKLQDQVRFDRIFLPKTFLNKNSAKSKEIRNVSMKIRLDYILLAISCIKSYRSCSKVQFCY